MKAPGSILLIKIVIPLILIVMLSGCGTVRRVNYGLRHTYFPVSECDNYTFTKDYPKSFTVYPFKNTTWYKEAAGRARQATFMAFSLVGPCASMKETDALATSPYTLKDALKVGRQLNTDAVIVGEALYQDHIWLLFYTHAYVKVSLKIYDTKTGKLIWNGANSAGSYNFGISLFLTPVMLLIEHGLWSRKTAALYNRANIDIIHDIRPDALAIE